MIDEEYELPFDNAGDDDYIDSNDSTLFPKNDGITSRTAFLMAALAVLLLLASTICAWIF